VLAGRPPFRAATPAETIVQVIADEPVPPSRLRRNLPRDLETICLHSLQKQPERRYASAAALADDLRRFLDNEPIRARPAGSVERAVKWVRRRPFRAALIGVTCLATIGLAGLSIWLWDSLQQRDAALDLAQTASASARQSEADAHASEARARLHLYPADLRVVNQLWKNGDLPAMRARLARHGAAPDERGFAWSLAFNPNGDTLATGEGGNVRLWDVATGRLLSGPLTGHKEPVTCVAFSPDGKLLASGGRDRRIHLWDLRGARPKMQVLAGHTSGVTCLAFAPDGRTLASGSGDRTVRLWHLASAQELATLEEHGGPVSCLAFTRDGLLLASGSLNGEVRLWRALPVQEPTLEGREWHRQGCACAK
jgi:eukaryotic-like serine/threonine-protein kinase